MRTWICFFADRCSSQWYASYISSYVWAGLFLGPKIRDLWKNRHNLSQFRKDKLK